MKQIIIIFATIILGLAIYTMVAADNDDSIYGAVKALWISEIENEWGDED